MGGSAGRSRLVADVPKSGGRKDPWWRARLGVDQRSEGNWGNKHAFFARVRVTYIILLFRPSSLDVVHHIPLVLVQCPTSTWVDQLCSNNNLLLNTVVKYGKSNRTEGTKPNKFTSRYSLTMYSRRTTSRPWWLHISPDILLFLAYWRCGRSSLLAPILVIVFVSMADAKQFFSHIPNVC